MTLGITLVSLPAYTMPLASGPLAYLDVRPEGPTVATAVFVPGYTGSKEDFGLLAAPLAEAGVRFVSVDLRGQHESPGPDDEAAYTVAALGAEVTEFLVALGAGPVHLVGHSFGGLVCRDAVLRDPSAVRTLTLLDSGPAGLSGPRVERMRAVAPVLDTYGPEALFDAILAGGPRPGPELEAFLRKRFLASSVAGLRAMGTAVTDEPDRVAELRAASVPVLVACGEYDDAWLPAVQCEMAVRLGAPYVVIPAAIHSPAAEAPAATARALLDFWADR